MSLRRAHDLPTKERSKRSVNAVQSNNTVQPRLLTIPQAAAYLATTTWAIRKLQWSRTVPYIRLGSRVLFDITDLDAFVDRAKLGGRFGTVQEAQ